MALVNEGIRNLWNTHGIGQLMSPKAKGRHRPRTWSPMSWSSLGGTNVCRNSFDAILERLMTTSCVKNRMRHGFVVIVMLRTVSRRDCVNTDGTWPTHRTRVSVARRPRTSPHYTPQARTGGRGRAPDDPGSSGPGTSTNCASLARSGKEPIRSASSCMCLVKAARSSAAATQGSHIVRRATRNGLATLRPVQRTLSERPRREVAYQDDDQRRRRCPCKAGKQAAQLLHRL